MPVAGGTLQVPRGSAGHVLTRGGHDGTRLGVTMALQCFRGQWVGRCLMPDAMPGTSVGTNHWRLALHAYCTTKPLSSLVCGGCLSTHIRPVPGSRSSATEGCLIRACPSGSTLLAPSSTCPTTCTSLAPSGCLEPSQLCKLPRRPLPLLHGWIEAFREVLRPQDLLLHFARGRLGQLAIHHA